MTARILYQLGTWSMFWLGAKPNENFPYDGSNVRKTAKNAKSKQLHSVWASFHKTL